jgi:hypothetical protein
MRSTAPTLGGSSMRYPASQRVHTLSRVYRRSGLVHCRLHDQAVWHPEHPDLCAALMAAEGPPAEQIGGSVGVLPDQPLSPAVMMSIDVACG